MRPEESDAEYQAAVPPPDDFEPWRPGDPSCAGESPSRSAASGVDDWRRMTARGTGERGRAGRGSQPAAAEQPRRRWWTEDVPPRRPDAGDRVRNTRPVGGSFVDHVPTNTRGQVVSTRDSLLGEHWATVEFESGYTEEVRSADLTRERGLFG